MSFIEKARDAKWIWFGKPGFDLVNSWMQARRSFRLKSVPKKALIGLTADSRYRLFVNGQAVCRGPARGFQESWPCDQVDIAPYLKRGKNVLTAIVHNFGIGHFGYISRGCAGFILWGRAGRVDLGTGGEWRVRPAPGYGRRTARVSRQMGFQELFDARLDDGRWMLPGYNDRSWPPPAVIRTFTSMPWSRIEERGIPMLREEEMLPRELVSTARGRCASGWTGFENFLDPYMAEKRKWRRADDKLRASGGWARLEVPPAGKKGFTAYCIDFGREVVGSLRFKVDGAAGGEAVDYLVSEAVDGLAPVFLPTKKLDSAMAFANRLILKRGRTEHEQFDHWGFRYLVLVVRGSTRKLNLRFKLRWVGYPLEVKAAFDSSNKRLNDVYEMSAWTQQCCMLDAYMDCPWREQAQWWGDARVQGRNTFYLAADARLLRRGIRQIGTQETPNGLSYGHTPTINHRCILPDFTLTWIVTHWDYYWQTGDLSLFKEMRARVGRALDFFRSATAANGLLPFDDRYWLFLDWCDLFKDGYPTPYNLFYIMALGAAARLFRLTGDRRQARECAAREEIQRRAIARRLFDRRKGTLHAGLTWKGRPVKQRSVHNYALAVLLDLCPKHSERFGERVLVPFVRGEPKGPLAASPFFMFYVFEALKKLGRNAEVIDCIERWWGGMVDRGLSTTEEVWNAEAGEWSLCHAWSAHPVVHLPNVMLGIRQAAPAWKQVRFEPTFAGAERVRGRVPTPQGTVESGWERTPRGLDVFLKLPRGVAATAVLPGMRKERVRGRRKWRLETG